MAWRRTLAAFLFAVSWAHARPTAIEHVTVIDVISGATLAGRTVLIDHGVITAIGHSGQVSVPADSVRVDGAGKFLIPGLWDMHIHFRGGKQLIPDNEVLLSLFTALGITGVREMGGDFVETVFRWRKQINAGRRIGPHIITSGPKLDGPKPAWPGSIPVKDAMEGQSAVRRLKSMGADFVKLYFPGLSRDTFTAILDEARAQHLAVSGHLPSASMSVREFVDSGVHSIEHSRHYILPGCSTGEAAAFGEMRDWVRNGRKPPAPNTNAKIIDAMDEPLCTELMQRLRQHDVWVTPTLVVTRRTSRLGREDFTADPRRKYVGPGIWKSWMPDGRRKPPSESALSTLERVEKLNFDLVARMQKAGVGLLAGSDSGHSNNFTFPAFSLHEELRMMVDAGLTPAEALRIATWNPARYLRQEATAGSVEKGKRADLVLLNANPLDDIANTEKIDAVILHGRLLRRKQLDELLARASDFRKR
ncbi:MAG: amidohydrolase family protein [Acidobacteria bacterium]|nr:amidohydrolase family protein [Acidobacteriota bacterium]